MAESSWPCPDHNSRAVNDSEYEQLVSPGLTSALVGSPNDSVLIYGDSSARVVKVRADRFGLVRGHIWYSGSTVVSKTIVSNSGATRYDLVTLRFDRSTLNVNVHVITGTPGSGVPSMTRDTGTTGVFDIPLASVKVTNGASVIDGDDVTPLAYYLGPQDIVCLHATRPSHAAGRHIYEVDTGDEYVSNGTAWIKRYEDTDWVPVDVAEPNWSNVAARVRRIDRVVFMMFEVTRTGPDLSSGTNSVMGTVPDKFRPEFITHVNGYADGSTVVRANVGTDGKITIDNYSFLYTSGSGKDAKLATGGPLQKGVTVTLHQCATWPAAG